MARWLPAALFVLGVALELSTPREVTISAPFAAAPLAAAAFLSLWSTVLTGVLSSSATLLFAIFHDNGSLIESEARSLTSVTVSVVAVGVNYVLLRSGSRLASARGVAEAVQLAVLPTPPSHVDDLTLATRYRAAQAEARVGGDFYAAEETSHGVRLLLGDVRGKGTGAVAAVVLLVGVFREAAEQEETLSAVAARLDRALQREGRRQTGSAQLEGFSTAVLVEIPNSSGPGSGSGQDTGRDGGQDGGQDGGEQDDGKVLRIVNRGHPPPILLYQGRTALLEPTMPALPLGMSELGKWPEHVDEVAFPRGAQLLLYTDGLSEARDADGVFYEPAERLDHSYFTHPEELLETVLIDVAAHTGGQAVDDMALLAVAHHTGPQP
ncbi:serine/threonine-protein phosphatase [Streptomyces sp. DW4-2]|uniref:Serine/threonine-protein phosphatase n=1 Tax=Streptomyces spirodelae TaxID=2812904 RepID=A0ABS3X055_9ACTN|nr:serine/threonine-protein phosphatase [Streptomyces spirodelae]